MEIITLDFLGVDAYSWLVIIMGLALVTSLAFNFKLLMALNYVTKDAIMGFNRVTKIIETLQSTTMVDHDSLIRKLSDMEKTIENHLQHIRDYLNFLRGGTGR
jgi:hypothetical protein